MDKSELNGVIFHSDILFLEIYVMLNLTIFGKDKIKRFEYANNIILTGTNMPFSAQVKFSQSYINELYKNLL